jgi:SAM-dependent methyltransferase
LPPEVLLWQDGIGKEKLRLGFIRLILDYEYLLPSSGRVLDAASGVGATGRYLAEKGFDVISLDISITGMRIAQEKYQEAGLPFHGAVIDLSDPWLPENHFNVILNFCFLERGTFQEYSKTLKPGGLIFFETFVKDQEDTGYSEHYLDQGELLATFQGFEVIHYDQMYWGCTKAKPQRKVDRVVVRKPS